MKLQCFVFRDNALIFVEKDVTLIVTPIPGAVWQKVQTHRKGAYFSHKYRLASLVCLSEILNRSTCELNGLHFAGDIFMKEIFVFWLKIHVSSFIGL